MSSIPNLRFQAQPIARIVCKHLQGDNLENNLTLVTTSLVCLSWRENHFFSAARFKAMRSLNIIPHQLSIRPVFDQLLKLNACSENIFVRLHVRNRIGRKVENSLVHLETTLADRRLSQCNMDKDLSYGEFESPG